MKLHTLRSKLTLSYALIIAIPVAIIMVCMLSLLSVPIGTGDRSADAEHAYLHD